MKLATKLLQITLLDFKTKNLVCNESGDELDIILADTEQLRKALGCPTKIFDGESTTVVLPLIKAAQRKLEQQIQTISTSNEVVIQEARDAHEAITELLLWMKKFPTSVLEVV